MVLFEIVALFYQNDVKKRTVEMYMNCNRVITKKKVVYPLMKPQNVTFLGDGLFQPPHAI